MSAAAGLTTVESEVVSSTPLAPADVIIIRPLFQFFDVDQDGYLTPREVELVYKHLGLVMDTPAFAPMEYAQVLLSVGTTLKQTNEAEDTEARLRRCFRLMVNQQRYKSACTEDTFARFIKELEIELSDEYRARIIELISSRGADSFSELDFLNFMKRHAQKGN